MPDAEARVSGGNEDARSATIEELFEETKWLSEQEDQRSSSLTQRAGVLLGFCGAAVALGAGQSKDLLGNSAELGSPGREIAVISLAVAIVLIVVAAVMCVLALWVKPVPVLATTEIAKFKTQGAADQPKDYHQDRLQRAMEKYIEATRAGNRERRALLTRAGATLLAAVVALTPYVFAYASDAYDGPECNLSRSASARGFANGNSDPNEPRVPCPDLETVRYVSLTPGAGEQPASALLQR